LIRKSGATEVAVPAAQFALKTRRMQGHPHNAVACRANPVGGFR
jgi:hypothetical protein